MTHSHILGAASAAQVSISNRGVSKVSNTLLRVSDWILWLQQRVHKLSQVLQRMCPLEWQHHISRMHLVPLQLLEKGLILYIYQQPAEAIVREEV